MEARINAGAALAAEIVDGQPRRLKSPLRLRASAFICGFIFCSSIFGAARAGEISFRNDVQPGLTKMGCNSGACHGALAGKNGFKLSLRGYDDAGDFRALTRDALGRRIVLEEPAKSLLLLKPTNIIPHKGGERFKPDSPEYRTLAEWIASGTPGPMESDPIIQSIEIVPSHVVLKPGMDQQLKVTAHFSDGSTQDATRLAKYTSADMTVASIDDYGKLKVTGYGEGPITAWYLSKNALATVTSPFDKPLPADTFVKESAKNLIDKLVLEKLKELNLPPSPLAEDSEFIRRAFVDTIGVLPTSDETRQFLADRSGNKRDRLIESLLN